MCVSHFERDTSTQRRTLNTPCKLSHFEWKLFEDTIELSSLRAAQNCSQNGQPTSTWCWDTFGSQDTFSTTDLVIFGADVTRITESISCRLPLPVISRTTENGMKFADSLAITRRKRGLLFSTEWIQLLTSAPS